MTIGTQRLRFLRGNTAAASAFTGLGGELVVDTDLGTIRVQDGYTPGGSTLATVAMLGNVSGGNYSNANVAAFLPTYTGNLGANNLRDLTGQALNLVSNNYVQFQYDPTGTYDPSNITTGSWGYIANGGFVFQSNVTGTWKNITLNDNGTISADGGLIFDGNLTSGNNTWNFGSNSVTTIPGTIAFSHGPQIYVSGTGANDSTITITANINNDINGLQANEATGITELYATNTVAFYTNTTGDAHEWLMDVNGLFTLPGALQFPEAGDGLYFGDTNHSIRRNGNSLEYHEWGDTLASGGGHKIYTNGIRDSQVLQVQIANDGVDINNVLNVTPKIAFPYNTDSNAVIDYSQDLGQYFILQNNLLDGYQAINLDTDNAQVLISSKNAGGYPLRTWSFDWYGQMHFPDNTVQTTAYQGPAGQTDFATNASLANYALLTGATFSGNVAANYFTGNGSKLTGIVSSYGDANVAVYAGNIAPGNINLSGIGTSGKVQFKAAAGTNGAYIYDSSGSVFLAPNTTYSATAGVTIGGLGYLLSPNGARNITLNYNSVNGQVGLQANVVIGTTASGGNLTVANNIVASGNIAGNYFIGNGALLTGISASSNYGNTNVSTYLGSNSNIIITTTGNVTAGYFVGNGALLTGIVAGSTYSNTNVASYLPTYTGNITAGNILSDNHLYANGVSILAGIAGNYGNTNVATYLSGNVSVGNLTANTNVSVTSNLTVGSGSGGFLFRTLAGGSGATIYGLGAAPSQTNYALSYNGASLNLNAPTGGGIYSSIQNSIVTAMTSTGLATTGLLSATGNIVGNNISANSFTYANGVNILSGITGSYANANVATYLASNSNITITTTANITGNFFVGNGSLLTGIVANTTYNNSNVASYLTGNIVVGNIAGSQPGVTLVANTYSYLFSNLGNVSFPGNLSVTSNISGTYFIGNGALLTGLTASSNFGNANVASYLAAYGSNTIVTTGNITAGNLIGTQVGNSAGTTATYTGNITGNNIVANSFTYTNGVSILTGISGTYANANVAAYLASNSAVPITTTSNVTAGYFVGNGSTLTGLVYNNVGNIYGSSSNVTLQAGSYNWTFDNTGNLVIPTTSNIVYANGVVFSSGSGGTGNYTNANVVSMLAANTAIFIGNTGNVATVYPLQSNITQVFIGGNTAITSGNAASPNSTFLMYNLYFAANGAIVARNTTTGAGYIVIDSTGISLNGYTGAVTANTTPTFNQFLKMNGSIGAQFSGAITASAAVTGVGLTSTNGLTLNTLGQISTNQTSASIFPATATSIAIGSTTSNVWVGNAVGNNTGTLIVRATGTYNTLTLFGIAGGYNSPPYTNQSLTGGSGTGMTANYSSVGGYVSTITVSNPGTGYKNGDVLTVPGGLGSTVILSNYNPNISNGTTIGLANYTFALDGNLTLPGSVLHPANSTIYGDFSNSTVNYRTIFQTSTANATTGIYAVPNGTNTGAAWQAANSSNLTNASKIMITTNGNTDVQLVSGINGSGTYLPLSFYNNGAAQMQLSVGGNLSMITGGNINTTGNIFGGNLIGTHVGNASGTTATYTGNVTVGNLIGTQFGNTIGTTATYTGNLTAGNLVTSGYGQFTGAFTESTTIAGVFVGNTGSGNPSPRIGFFNGNTTQNWQIDNYGGSFRWFTPNVTRMSLDPVGNLTVYGTLTANTDTTINGNLTVNGINSGYAPNRPAFRVAGNGGAITGNTIVSGGYMVVDYNQGGYLNTSTGYFTAPVAGLYQICLVTRTNSNSYNGIIQSIIQKISGATSTTMIMVEYGNNTTMNHTGGSTIAKLAVGDQLRFLVSTGTISFDGNDNWSVAYLG